jgi:ATP-binding protein involved in chromosome partitioning
MNITNNTWQKKLLECALEHSSYTLLDYHAATFLENEKTVQIQLGYPADPTTRTTLTDALHPLLPFDWKMQFKNDIPAFKAANHCNAIPGVKNLIGIGSGKGGVGKSTVALYLALALQRCGASVGLLDGDLYGPNQAQLLGHHQRPTVDAEKKMDPITVHGLQSMSMGYLLDPQTPSMWRGPMLSSAFMQLATQTQWQDLDYLIVDLPPGTGDIQLSLCQKLPLVASLIVATPQTIACQDAERAIMMFKKLHTPILGLLENFSLWTCPHCEQNSQPFGPSQLSALAQKQNLNILGKLIFETALNQAGNSGQPLALEQSQNPWEAIALTMTQHLATLPRSISHSLNKIPVATT